MSGGLVLLFGCAAPAPATNPIVALGEFGMTVADDFVASISCNS